MTVAAPGTMINHGALSSKVLTTMKTRPPPLEVMLPQVVNQAISIETPLAATNPATFVVRGEHTVG